MKFAAIAALVATSNAARIMSMDAAPESATPVELAEEGVNAGSVDDYKEKSYQYPIEQQNFNGILGMLGTPTSMTTQLHTMFNQIHFNERVMRQIREIVNDTPELVETLCADGTDTGSKNQCKCPVGNNILYGAITDEGKIDYMLGFAQDIATEETTECSDKTFGDPVPDAEKYCWCQEWESDKKTSAKAQTYSAHEVQGLAALAQITSQK